MRTINIKEGMPSVEEATTRLRDELRSAHILGVRLIKVVHGYGSSGRGGKIRAAVHKALLRRKKEGVVSHVIFGEKWSIFNAEAIQVLDEFPDAKRDGDLDRYNWGITILSLNGS